MDYTYSKKMTEIKKRHADGADISDDIVAFAGKAGDFAAEYANQIINFIGGIHEVDAPLVVAAMRFATDAIEKTAAESIKAATPESYDRFCRLSKSLYDYVSANITVTAVAAEVKDY